MYVFSIYVYVFYDFVANKILQMFVLLIDLLI